MSKIKQAAIEAIEALYPPCGTFEKTQEIGRELLISAILAAMEWQDLPEPVLVHYAEMCKDYELLVFEQQ